MSIEIKVGPPVITISQGRTFMVTDQRGFIDPDSDQGVYAIDTRFNGRVSPFASISTAHGARLVRHDHDLYSSNEKRSAEGVGIQRFIEREIHSWQLYLINQLFAQS